MSAPSWLPSIEDTNGNWDEVVTRLYAIFERDFKRGRPVWEGRPIWWDLKVEEGSLYEEGFWHLISREDANGIRLPDFPRAQRLAWCAAIIRNHSDQAVKVWNFREDNGVIRTYLWLEEYDYAIVMERWRRKKGDIYFLVTGHYVDGDWKRKQLLKKFEARLP